MQQNPLAERKTTSQTRKG